MKKIEELTLEECRRALGTIQEILYADYDVDEMRHTLDPDHEWTSDNIADVAAVLELFDLVPNERILLGPIEGDNEQKHGARADKNDSIVDFVMREWDEEHMGVMPRRDDEAVRIFEEYYAKRNVPLPWKEGHDKDKPRN